MAKYSQEAGTALAEFVVLMVVLVPLMFGIPMIGKMIDLKQTTTQASRYNAWETTVNSSMPSDVGKRFFSDPSNPIGEESAGPNLLWGAQPAAPESAATVPDGSQSTSSSPLVALSSIASDTRVVVDAASANVALSSAYTADQHGAVAGEGPALKIGKFVNALAIKTDKTGGSWGIDGGMNTDGLVRGEASATMQGNGWLDDRTFTQGTVIMNDNWSVGDALAARDRVRTLVPAGALKPIGKFLGTVGKVPGLKELKYFKHDNSRGVFGYVNMEPLPESETGTLRPLKPYEGE